MLLIECEHNKNNGALEIKDFYAILNILTSEMLQLN